MKMSYKKRIPWVVLLALGCFISACQAPIVPVRNYTYVVSFVCDGKEYTLKTKYKCHYEDLNWISERGADWHLRRESIPIIITKALDNNISIEVLPLLGSANICSPNTVDVNSFIFVQDQNDRDILYGFDQEHTTSYQHNIRIISSRLEFEGASHGIFKKRGDQRHPRLLFKSYYTIGADIIPSDEITRSGLREYVTNRKSIWLKEGRAYPFIRWSDEDVDAYVKYGKILLPHIEKIRIAGNKVGNDWEIDKSHKTRASQWYVHPINVRTFEGVTLSDQDKPKQWIRYNGCHIQIPLIGIENLHFYDPVNDEIVLFRVIRKDLTLKQ